MGDFQIFGMETTMSIILLIAFLWGVAVIVALVVVVSCCCVRRCRQARLENAMPPPQVTDKLIPPIFFTEQLRDPLEQEDLREHANHG
jgi:heme/copper-type cytochrome/quinol oxidase subunit 2